MYWSDPEPFQLHEISGFVRLKLHVSRGEAATVSSPPRQCIRKQ